MSSDNTTRNQRKWGRILAAFMQGNVEDLRSIHRTGTRGRIFAFLIGEMLKELGASVHFEPVFAQKAPIPWYAEFAAKHGIKLRTHPFYYPDILFDDGSWVEATVSGNEAYKKLFRYGHQATRLTVIWLDEDEGMHKSICQGVKFPNAEVVRVDSFYAQLKERQQGRELIERFECLKGIKGVVL